MGTGVGWPDVAMALIEFAKTQPILFLLTVPTTGIVVLAGAFLLLRIIVIKPISMSRGTYEGARRVRGRRNPPELPLK